ncbi:MAG: Crp/Fnr family transcriptional regulator [Pseudomonadota bacterium]
MPEVRCNQCPLRRLPLFIENSVDEIALVQSVKRREAILRAGELLIHEGQKGVPLFTLLDGWAFRFKTLSDGRRQILNFLLPGDLIGVQQKTVALAAYGVMALTEAVFCVFHPNALWDLHHQSPSMGFNLTWLGAHEESLVDEGLLSLGRRGAEERIAALLVQLFARVARRQADAGVGGVPFPLKQQHMADALGMSLVHTNKSLRKLQRRGLHRLEDGRLHILDTAALMQIADLHVQTDNQGASRLPLV